MNEHPFAPYIRILGKGPRLSRSLTQDEARTAAGMILDGAVEPVQLGAFLCLLRVRTETPEEIAGFAQAIRERRQLPAGAPAVDLDWPSYAGKSRRLPLFILAALLLAQSGVPILMHGSDPHTAGRLYTEEALSALGLTPADTVDDAFHGLARTNFAYVRLKTLNPRLEAIMGLKSLLGVRSPLHTVLRNINPFDARVSLMSVFHPNYRTLHCGAAHLMGQKNVACFKGDGGEVERRPEKPCVVEGLTEGAAFTEEWPAWDITAPPAEEDLDPGLLGRLWQGEAAWEHAEAVVVATAAVALKALGRATTFGEAEAEARRRWQTRQRTGALA